MHGTGRALTQHSDNISHLSTLPCSNHMPPFSSHTFQATQQSHQPSTSAGNHPSTQTSQGQNDHKPAHVFPPLPPMPDSHQNPDGSSHQTRHPHSQHHGSQCDSQNRPTLLSQSGPCQGFTQSTFPSPSGACCPCGGCGSCSCGYGSSYGNAGCGNGAHGGSVSRWGQTPGQLCLHGETLAQNNPSGMLVNQPVQMQQMQHMWQTQHPHSMSNMQMSVQCGQAPSLSQSSFVDPVVDGNALHMQSMHGQMHMHTPMQNFQHGMPVPMQPQSMQAPGHQHPSHFQSMSMNQSWHTSSSASLNNPPLATFQQSTNPLLAQPRGRSRSPRARGELRTTPQTGGELV